MTLVTTFLLPWAIVKTWKGIYNGNIKRGVRVFEELGITGGSFIILMILLYYVIKWAVKNGIREAFGIKDKVEDREIERLQEYIDMKNGKE